MTTSMNARPSAVCTAWMAARTESFASMNGGVLRARARSAGVLAPGSVGRVVSRAVGGGFESEWASAEEESEESFEDVGAEDVGSRCIFAFSRFARAI
jgi:hypothetical protein